VGVKNREEMDALASQTLGFDIGLGQREDKICKEGKKINRFTTRYDRSKILSD